MEEFSCLSLKDGNEWVINGEGTQAEGLVDLLRLTMGLDNCASSKQNQLLVQIGNASETFASTVLNTCNEHSPIRHSSLHANVFLSQPPVRSYVTVKSANDYTCRISPYSDRETMTYGMMAISLVIARRSELDGGLLIHGAIASRNGHGVILAGGAGIGKSTASSRLKPPWRSLADDTTLIVKGKDGNYWAHPWPSWGNFFFNKSGEKKWNVQRAVRLKGIFFLSRQKPENGKPKLDLIKSIGLLDKSANETILLLTRDKPKNDVRPLREQRFNIACEMAKIVPCFLLHVTLKNPFWETIETCLNPKQKI